MKIAGDWRDEGHAALADMGSIQKQVIANLHRAIEARLRELVAAGIAIEEIRLEHRPGPETRIIARGKCAGSFRITWHGLDGRPVDE